MLDMNLEPQIPRSNYKILAIASISMLAMVSVVVFVVAVSNNSMTETSAPTNLVVQQSDSRENLKRQLFENWKALYSKSYLTGDEYDNRYQIWSKNYDWVEDYMKQPDLKFTVGMNQFADLTNEEYKSKLHIGTCLLKKPSQNKTNVVKLDTQNLPKSIDWRTKGAVTPVKNQGQCGSCWAFSTTGSMEGLNFITNKKLASFSEQQLVDCSESFGNQGCNGGLMDNAFQYTEAKGLEAESVYPYKAVDGKCKYSQSKIIFKNTGYEDVPDGDNDALAAAVAIQPISIGIEADSMAFQMYTGGVFNDKTCGTNIDHGVLLVGYGQEDQEDYWIVKNSWGDSWGDSGFIKMAKQSGKGAGMCGIASSASYPTYKSSMTPSVNATMTPSVNATMNREHMISHPLSTKTMKNESQSSEINDQMRANDKAESSSSKMNPSESDIFEQTFSLKQEDIDNIANILKNAIDNIENSNSSIAISNELDEVLKELNNGTSPHYFISSSINYRRNDTE